MKKWIFSTLILVGALSLTPAPEKVIASCVEAITSNVELARQVENTYAEAIRFNQKRLQPQLRYRKGTVVTPDSHIKLGFESEYTQDERAEKLLTLYGPATEFGIKTQEWMKKTGAEKVKWVKDNQAKLFTEKRQAGKMVKIALDKKWNFLPQNLIVDTTGNLEIIVSPFNSLEEWFDSVTRLNKEIMEGSMQTTLGIPSELFFGRNRQNVEGAIGFFKFFADSDAVQKLDRGFDRVAENPNAEVAKSFQHPFLGPLTLLKSNLLEKTLRTNANGLGFQDLAFVSGSDVSFKYLGSTVYRPDIAGPNSIVMEVRDAHSDMDVLRQRVLRGVFFLENGMDVMAPAASLASFDSDKTFALLPSDVRNALKEIFPTKLKPNEKYTPEEVFSLEVYRNFAFPMRDWTGHLKFIQRPEIAPQIAAAQKTYLENLKQITSQLVAGKIDKKQASIQYQIAITRFARASGLARAVTIWERNMLSETMNNKKSRILLPYGKAG